MPSQLIAGCGGTHLWWYTLKLCGRLRWVCCGPRPNQAKKFARSNLHTFTISMQKAHYNTDGSMAQTSYLILGYIIFEKLP
jgi:hypothetical protein